MTNELLSAISIALWNEFHSDTDFGDEMLIAKETVEQEMTPPCFTIRCLEPNTNPQLKGMIHTLHTFEVDFFPNKGNRQINDVAERLDSIFEILKVTENISYKCTNRNKVISDGVLVMTFEIETYMSQSYEKEEEMEDINIESPEVE